MERSYARGTWYGFDRARWRGLWRVEIQEYLISAVQNIQVLLKYGSYLKRSPSVMMEEIKWATTEGIWAFSSGLRPLIRRKFDKWRPFGFIRLWPSLIET